MSEAPIDPRWPKILSLSVHEFRSPLTVVAGYVAMLLKDRTGPLTKQQRHMLEETQKSCSRLTDLLKEVSDLSTTEKGEAPLKQVETDLHSVLRAAVEQLPPAVDREIAIDLQLSSKPAMIRADIGRLTNALKWILGALRRELVGTDRLIVREHSSTRNGAPAYQLRIGDEETLAALDAERADGRLPFDEWRGGNGMLLPVARRIIDAHGGRIWDPPNAPAGPDGKAKPRKAGARIVLPRMTKRGGLPLP
jgi:light-regulated signal transduction histidine kinase (bacteriophytochrome)